MKKIILIFAVALASLSCENNSEGVITEVSPEEIDLILDLEKVQLIDVRTAEEFDLGHIINAQNININSDSFDADIELLDKEQPVVLYCKSGNRSAMCAKKMKDAGFKKIYDLKEGFSKWKHIDLNTTTNKNI
ncbi:rhodanese-like domain-containing protein [Bizionia gelidisalsuginis]|uniref:Rhodanese-like domain-containing protein n=2 Tax=Bizionia TaxID=283785 RepID=A0A8H2QLM0_9FLAO|nr:MULTISPECIES: rhodanese-like domain-containing protein [Bizionia]TYB74448.1 rhodanese-like domain-containing protein [Bizionia saleffrena]TYC16243.1 rhodanese-like domain-containing protein [Bizionia gelidisalsuginis]